MKPYKSLSSLLVAMALYNAIMTSGDSERITRRVSQKETELIAMVSEAEEVQDFRFLHS